MRLSLTLLILTIVINAYGQATTKAENAAYKCLDKTLGADRKALPNLLELFSTLEKVVKKGDLDFSKAVKSKIVDQLFKSPFFENKNLQEHVLITCMTQSYNPIHKKSDTTSTFHQTLRLLQKLKDSSQQNEILSISDRIKIIEPVLNREVLSNKLYKAIYTILMVDIISDSERIDNANNRPERMELPSGNVDDAVEINMNVQMDTPPCGDPDLVYTIVENAPQFNGGSIKDYLRVTSEDIEGKVFVKFIIDCTGISYNFQVIQSLSPKADEIALKLVKEMPAWTPGMQRGKRVKVTMVVPVTFK